MTANEYILGLMAIVSGLAITEWLSSLYRLLSARLAVKWDWLAALGALFSIYAVVSSWWISWRSFGPETNLTLGRMLTNLSMIGFLFLAARASLPEAVPEEGLDMRAHYERNGWLLWGGLSASAAMLVGVNLLYNWRFVVPMWWMEAMVVAGAVLAVAPRRRLHALLAPATVALYVAMTIGERMGTPR